MKICWDNLDKLKYSKRTGKWYKGNNTYVYEEHCRGCGEPYLRFVGNNNGDKGKTCSPECRRRGLKHSDEAKANMSKVMKEIYSSPEKHPWYGRKHSDESIEKMRNAKLGKKLTDETKRKISEKTQGENNPFYGKHHTDETKQKISEANNGEGNGFWKGGSWKYGFPLYDTYAPQLGWCESVRRNEDNPNMLEVKCTYCGKWYTPKPSEVQNRVCYMEDDLSRLYCSEECKHACPLYGKSANTLMKEDATRAGRIPWVELDREVQPELREMVLERDEYTCVKCGSTEKLFCHHILPVATNPLESADMDNCITLCEDCHKEVHKLPGCSYGEIRTCIEYGFE